MSARAAALALFVSVTADRRTLDAALDETASYAALTGRDRAFARALATAGLRRFGGVEAVLSRFLNRPLPESAVHGRALLHLGATELLVLGTPAHAAVGESVSLANSARETRGFAGLINAVLRRVAHEGAAIFRDLPPGADLPPWLYARWQAGYGEEASGLAAAVTQEPPLDLTVRADAPAWAERLGGQLTPTGSVRLLSPSAVHSLTGFDDGAWWVQDAAAALPARMLGDVGGQRVLDLCAAPGGKTLQLAAAGARVTAVDKSEARLARLRENLARTKLSAEAVCADALDFRAPEPFDAVLLDAPCTATGTLRRHPDIAWLRRPADIQALCELQMRLIDAAMALVRPGGRLVYAVCSLEPEEGPAVAAQALQSGWAPAPLSAGDLAGADEFLTAEGALRTLPSRWSAIGGLDGFYAVRLSRPKAG